MNYPKYPFTSSSKSLIFEFVSNGINGSINKAISYTCVNEKDQIYNLCFGDNLGIDPETGELKIDDLAVSNNRDMPKILATVASSAYIFSNEYPDRKIFFRGSTPARTRLYRQAISKEYDEISKNFDIFGAIVEGNKIVRVPFDKNGNFEGFFIKVKQDETN